MFFITYLFLVIYDLLFKNVNIFFSKSLIKIWVIIFLTYFCSIKLVEFKIYVKSQRLEPRYFIKNKQKHLAVFVLMHPTVKIPLF